MNPAATPASADLTGTLTDALTHLTAAAALGMTVPAIPGMKVYWAIIDNQDDDIDLGLYPTREDALIEIRNHVLEQHDQSGWNVPWDTFDWHENRRAYLDTHTDEQIIATMYDENDWTISELTIWPHATRNQ